MKITNIKPRTTKSHHKSHHKPHRLKHILLVMSLGFAPWMGLGAPQRAIAEEVITIPQEPVQPSLWWKSQRLEEGWIEKIDIDANAKKAIVTVNISRWVASDYLTRFSFLFKLGTEAQRQNFDLVLHNRRSEKIAEYSNQQDYWRIEPKSLGADPFRVNAPLLLQ